MYMNLINLVLGIVLLTTGKKLYWLFVGVIGFVIGMAISTQYVLLTPSWLRHHRGNPGVLPTAPGNLVGWFSCRCVRSSPPNRVARDKR
jgi:hypothetical protein